MTRKTAPDQLAAWRRAAEAGEFFAADNVLLLLDDLAAAEAETWGWYQLEDRCVRALIDIALSDGSGAVQKAMAALNWRRADNAQQQEQA